MEDEALVLTLIEQMRASGAVVATTAGCTCRNIRRFTDEQQVIWLKAAPLFGDEPWWVRDLATQTGTDENTMRSVLRQAAQQG